MLRIAVYARVSTSDKGQDPENQLRELRQFVANKAAEGWAPAGEYVDHVSGKNANRPPNKPASRRCGGPAARHGKVAGTWFARARGPGPTGGRLRLANEGRDERARFTPWKMNRDDQAMFAGDSADEIHLALHA